MKHLSIYLLNGLFMCPLLMQAQVTPKEQRKILFEVSEVFDNYERTMFASDEAEKEEFKSLFVSDETPVYNDILGFDDRETITLKEYASTLNKMVKSATIRLKEVQSKGIEDWGSHYLVRLLFDKNMSYSDPDGILFSNDDYYNQDYNLAMEISVDKETFEGKISKITGHIDSDKPRLKRGNYVVLNRTNPLDSEVKCNGELLSFNSFDQAILPPVYKFTYGDPDMKIVVRKAHEESRLISLGYKLKSWNIMPYYEMSLMDPYEVTSTSEDVLTKSSMQEVGLKFRRVFPRKSNVKWGFCWGVGYSMSTIDLDLESTSYYYRTSNQNADIDGDLYDRHYNIKNVHQSVDLSQVVVPIALNMECKIGKRFSLDFEAGVKGYMTLKGETKEFSLDQDVYGQYPNYNNMILDGSWGFNNFGQSSLGMSNLINPELETNTFMVDAFGGMGMSLKLFGPLSISAGVKYQYGILKPFKDNLVEAPLPFNNGHINEGQALVHYNIYEGDKTNGLMGATQEIKRAALLLNVGLNFKF